LVISKKAASEMGIRGRHLVSSILNDIAEINIVYVTGGFQPCREAFDERFIFTSPWIENTRKSSLDIPYEKMKNPSNIHIIGVDDKQQEVFNEMCECICR
jgi:hypothetical protein